MAFLFLSILNLVVDAGCVVDAGYLSTLRPAAR